MIEMLKGKKDRRVDKYESQILNFYLIDEGSRCICDQTSQ